MARAESLGPARTALGPRRRPSPVTCRRPLEPSYATSRVLPYGRGQTTTSRPTVGHGRRQPSERAELPWHPTHRTKRTENTEHEDSTAKATTTSPRTRAAAFEDTTSHLLAELDRIALVLTGVEPTVERRSVPPSRSTPRMRNLYGPSTVHPRGGPDRRRGPAPKPSRRASAQRRRRRRYDLTTSASRSTCPDATGTYTRSRCFPPLTRTTGAPSRSCPTTRRRPSRQSSCSRI